VSDPVSDTPAFTTPITEGVTAPAFTPLADSALTITLGDRADGETSARVRAVVAGIQAASLPPVRDIAFGYAAVSVWYDALHTNYETMVAALTPIVQAAPPAGREHEIPVWYDGPDLDDVARRSGLSVSDVIARHAGRAYTVYFLGFVPGWAYLGDLDPSLVVPRRTEPRSRVPAGSVAIAGVWTGVYPYAIPGGWHLIGRTSVELFDPMREPPAVFAAGDRVRFVRAGE
jgi:KipI family sensor histidine kinase inhibitor